MALIAAIALSACTVKNTDTPGLTGPSEFALSLSITATPDSISQDGASQSSILVVARDANARPISALPIRMDMIAGGQLQDYGKLSARTIVTGTDGRATTVYTAPPAPPANLGGAGTVVSILATPTGTNFQTAQAQTVDIRLVPPGVILPPAGTPTAAFTVSPTTPVAKVQALFDGSSSEPGSGASTITSYVWDFGDNSAQGSGRTVNHVFAASGNFNVTLTVTNDRSVSASTTQIVSVNTAQAPKADFSFQPTAPGNGQTVFFDGSQSAAAEGHTITSYRWAFGDGATGTGVSASHVYATNGTYQVQLTVTDEAGQSATAQKPVVVSSTAPSADFQVSPSNPEVFQDVTFDASQARPGTGHTIVSYSWNFGDGGTRTGVVATHSFRVQGTYSVTLTVTDEAGQSTTASKAVAVKASVGPTASFTFSPAQPAIHQLVFFNAGTSTASPGHTITSYTWVFGDGGTGTGVTPSHGYESVGAYSVQVTVTDDIGQTATSSAQSVPVGAPLTLPPTPVFTFSPAAPGVNELVFFDASRSTAGIGHTIVRYDWTFGDGGTDVGVQPSHRYVASGVYLAALTVTDEIGQKVTSPSQSITVGNAATPTANFTFSPTNPVVTDVIVFDASSSTTAQGQSIVRLDWNFGDGTPVVTCTASGPNPAACGSAPGSNPTRIVTHQYAAVGTYSVNLVVTDSANRTASKSLTVTVAVSGNPTAAFSFSACGGGHNVCFDGTASTALAPATIVAYQWDFGDGNTLPFSPQATPAHLYAAAGNRTVTLTVRDSLGRVGSVSQVVPVP